MSMMPVAYFDVCKSKILPWAANISLIAPNNPRAMGNIMAVVAVLLTQPEHRAVASPIARRIFLGLEPTQRRDNSQKAKRLSRW